MQLGDLVEVNGIELRGSREELEIVMLMIRDAIERGHAAGHLMGDEGVQAFQVVCDDVEANT